MPLMLIAMLGWPLHLLLLLGWCWPRHHLLHALVHSWWHLLLLLIVGLLLMHVSQP